MVQYLPIEMAEVVDMRIEGAERIPSIASQLTAVCRLVDAVWWHCSAHLREQAVCHPQGELRQPKLTLDFEN